MNIKNRGELFKYMNILFCILIIFIIFIIFAFTAKNAYAAAYPQQHSEAEKEDERVSALSLNNEIKNSIASGEKEFKVPEGVYRFNNSLTGPLVIENAKNLTIDFQDSLIYSEKASETLLIVKNCKDVVIKNLSLDYDPLPYLQGVISEIDTENKTVSVTFDEGYPLPDGDWVNNAGSDMELIAFTDERLNYLSAASEYKTFLMFLAPSTSQQPNFEAVSGRIFKIRLARDYVYEPDTPVKVGTPVIINRRMGRVVLLFGCENVTLENVNAYASNGYCFNEAYGVGRNRYNNVRIIRRPGTDRLIASSFDGFHSSCMEFGPVIENCRFEYAGDDFINVRGFFNVVMAVNENSLYIAGPSSLKEHGDNRTFKVGNDMEFYSYTGSEFKYIQKNKITEITPLDDAVSLSEISENMYNATGAKIRTGLNMQLYEVKFDGYISGISQYFLCFDRNLTGAGAIVRNNNFANTQGRAVVLQCDNGAVLNNVISNTGLSSIKISGSASGLESGLPKNIIVKGNKIYNANMLGSYSYDCKGAIYAGVYQGTNYTNSYRTEGIDVCDNYFFNCNSYVFDMNMANKSSFCNNRIYGANLKQPLVTSPCDLTYCELIESDNELDGEFTDLTGLNTQEYTDSDQNVAIFTKPYICVDNDLMIYDLSVFSRGRSDFVFKMETFDAEGNIVNSLSSENDKLFAFTNFKGNQEFKDGYKCVFTMINGTDITQMVEYK